MRLSGQRHASAALYDREWTPNTHWIGGWVGLRAGLGTEARVKIICLCRGSSSGRPVCSETLCWLSYPSSQVQWYRNYTYHQLQQSITLHFALIWFSGKPAITSLHGINSLIFVTETCIFYEERSEFLNNLPALFMSTSVLKSQPQCDHNVPCMLHTDTAQYRHL
jgi:hypothetical protein